MVDYKDYITVNPLVRFGKPCIRGTKISVYEVLNLVFVNGMSLREIQIDYPELSEAQIQACLAFAADQEQMLSVVPE